MSTAGYIQGNNVVLSFSEAADSSNKKVWGCCRNVSLTGNTEVIEVTPIDGVNTAFKPTYNNAKLDADGIYIIPEYTDPQWASVKFWEWRVAHTLLFFEIVFEKSDGSTDIYSGTCYLTDTVMSGAVNDVAGITISAVIISDNAPSQEQQIACPVLSLDSTSGAVTYSFTDAGEGATKYYVNLLSGSNVLLDTDVVTPPFSSPITGSFTGLNPATLYKVQIDLEQDSPYYQRSCAAVNINTEEIPCPVITLTPGDTNIAYSFNDSGLGVGEYLIEIFDGMTLIDSDTKTAPFTNPLTGDFTGLSTSTSYSIYITITKGAYTKECGPYVATTGGGVSYSFTVQLGNTLGGICSELESTVYSGTNEFGDGMTLYTDAGLTSPVTGFNYVNNVGGFVFNLNAGTGVVGLNTGEFC